MSTVVQAENNVPFLPHQEGGAFFVIDGTVNIYHSIIASDGKATGLRTFLFQMLEGELFIPLAPYTRDDGSSVGLLAIPASDSDLNRTNPVLSAAMRPYVEEFVQKCGRSIGYSREKIEQVCLSLDETGIDGFTRTFMQIIDEYTEEEAERVKSANRRRYDEELGHLHSAVNTLGSVVKGSKKDISGVSGVSDSIIMACSAVAQEAGIKVTIPKSVYEAGFSGDAVESIALASRFRTREVILTDKWHTQSGGNLLATMQGTGDPVALLQKSPRRYELYNPATGERIKVTEEIAETISPKAKMFYRSLPMHSLKGREIISFVVRGTGKVDWAWVFAMGLLGGLLGMLFPEITGRVFDQVIPQGDRNTLIQIGFLMGGVALTSFAFELTRSFSLQRISGVIERDLQSAVWDRLVSLPISFFKRYPAGELFGKAMSISQIQQVLSGVVVNTIITSLFSVFYLIVMFTRSVRLSFIGLAIALVTLLISLGLGYLQLKYEGKQLQVDNKISGRMFGWLSGLAKIKMSGAEKRTFAGWAGMYKESRAITYRNESIGNWSAVWNSSVGLLTSIIIFFAMFRLRDASLSIGAFIAFNTALSSLIGATTQFSAAILSANVIGPLYKEAKPIFEAVPEYDEKKTEAPPLAGDIELSRVNFSYIKDGPQVLKDVSFRIRSGEHVALVGPSGCGKTTLFRILLAFEQPDSGEIYFDGFSIDQLDIRSVRRQLGVVLQQGFLMAGSIFENIAGANPNITQEDAMHAIRQAGMEEDLKEMPMGLHTVVSEGTGTLSGGQRQRLMIARALAGKPKILFFDEATSALDNKTQKIVTDSVNKLRTTRITIAHRLSTIADCDRIIVLDDGRIVEEGTYDELMKLDGSFAEMARRQQA